jgi:cell wall-associated NlpC family hydrolase
LPRSVNIKASCGRCKSLHFCQYHWQLIGTVLAFPYIHGQNAGMRHCTIGGLTVLALPILLGFGGCSTAPSAGSNSAFTGGVEVQSRLSPELAADITIGAVGLVGTPYRYGGNTPDSGFDCSGLIGYIYQSRTGVAPPRTVSKMQDWGLPVPVQSVRSGDLILFLQNDVVTHAGIYVGDGRFVHAPSTGGEVRLDYLNSKYWASQQVSFRRL